MNTISVDEAITSRMAVRAFTQQALEQGYLLAAARTASGET